MLSSEVKALISAAVELYSTVPLTQVLIDEGTNKLTKAKELLLSQKEEPSGKQYKTWLLNPLFAENLIENAFVNAITGNQQTQTKNISEVGELLPDLFIVSGAGEQVPLTGEDLSGCFLVMP